MQPHMRLMCGGMMKSSNLWLPDFGSISLMAQLLPAWHTGWHVPRVPPVHRQVQCPTLAAPQAPHTALPPFPGLGKTLPKVAQAVCPHSSPGYLCSHSVWHKTLNSAGSVHIHRSRKQLSKAHPGTATISPCSHREGSG